MPELPEIESLRRMLARSARGRMIVDARFGPVALRRRRVVDFSGEVRGRRIERVSRRAKYLLLELSGSLAILAHLGMSGSLTHRRQSHGAHGLDPRHDHAEFMLDDGSRLVYNDPRRFGTIRLIRQGAPAAVKELEGLGPEPLGSGFNAEYLAAKVRGRRAAIKSLLMDQRMVAGIGNIYAAEILFRAGVRPSRPGGRLKRGEVERIARFVPEVLRAAIGSGGTTFRSYRDSRGRPGQFAKRLMVYGREGQPCHRCSAKIKNVFVGQRASFYCPNCQR